MTEKEKRDAALLEKAARLTGNDPRKIKNENPFLKSGATAKQIQMGVSELDPRRAAEWRREAPGGEISVATLNECMAGGELSPAAMQELWEKDPQFVVERQREIASQEERDKQWLEEQTAATQLRNKAREFGGDVDRAREALKFEAERDAQLKAQREESQRHAHELNQRLERQRIEHARMAGRLV